MTYRSVGWRPLFLTSQTRLRHSGSTVKAMPSDPLLNSPAPAPGHTAIEIAEVCLPEDDEANAYALLKPFAERFKLHPLTVEDCVKRNQRCKLETYESYLFMVWHLYTGKGYTYHELQLCLTANAILIVAEGEPPEGKTWREYLLRSRASDGSLKQAAISIMDRLVDDAEDHLEVLQDGAAGLESEILERNMDPREVVSLKGLVRQFTRSIRSAQPIFNQLIDLTAQLPQIGTFSPEERLRLRNVTDHMTRLLEATQLLEGQMGTLMDVHWGALGARTNRQMQRLTTIATVFLPVSFWSGLFGMNFETMPFKENWFFYLGMGLLGGTWVVVIAYMLQRGVFQHEQFDRRKPLFPGKTP